MTQMIEITFGKFRGQTIDKVDLSYLKWGSENLKGEWKENFKEELERRSLDIALAKKPLVENPKLDSEEQAIEDEIDTNQWQSLLPKQEDPPPEFEQIFKDNFDSILSTNSKYDPLIFGKDQTEEIVNITIKDDKVYTYFKDGSEQVKDYQNWILNCEDKGKRLQGHQYYKHIKHTDQETYDRVSQEWSKTRWCPRSKEEGYMLFNGVTYFKGMRVEDVSILSVDIETTGINENAEDAKVLLISNTFRKNGKYERLLLDLNDFKDDSTMLNYWSAWLIERNPDIILGHNIIGFDLNYMKSRNSLDIGRDGSEITFDRKMSKFRKDGTQSYEFLNPRIHGREIVDTMFLSIKYDVARHFPSYGLKAIEKHLGLVDENRIEWDFNKYPPREIYQQGGEIWEKFKEYCRQDSDSPIKMFDIMVPSFFYMNQSIPKTLQQMINEATGSQLDSIMIRSYLQDGHSIPRSSQKEEFEGAISMGVSGVYENVRKIDVAALYPSIMLQYEIYDKRKDPKRNMLNILTYFREERLKNKKLMKDTGDKYYDDLQGSQKILINSLYGFLGANFLLFNYPDGASKVTKYGREILQKAVVWATGHELEHTIKKVVNEGKENEETKYHWVIGKKVEEGNGYILVNCDTDSIAYTNGNKPTKEEFKKEIEVVNSLYPENIRFEDDGVFEKFIVFGAKNYIMQKDGETKTKGSSVTDQKREPALRGMLDAMLSEMLDTNKHQVILEIYKSVVKEALDIKNIRRWCTKKTYTETMEESDRANELKPMVALKEAVNKGVLKNYQQGDKFFTYCAIDGEIQKMVKGVPQFVKKTGEPKMISNEILRVPELWNNDHDVMHYVARVYSTLEILESVLDMSKFVDYSKSKNKTLLNELISE